MSDGRGEGPTQEFETARVVVDTTGIPNLDLVLGGGLPRGALVLVMGPPGSGKTTLANQVAFSAARHGRRALILTALSEPTNKLVAHLRSFSFFDESLIGDSIQVLSLQQFLPRGLQVTADEMVTLVRQSRASFVMIDGFRGIRGADGDPQAARQFLYEIGTALGIHGATTLITSEAEPRDTSLFPEATTADVLVGLHYRLDGLRQRRAIEAIKVRGAAPLPGLHSLALTAGGAVVYPRLEARVVMASDGDRTDDATLDDAADAVPGVAGDKDGAIDHDRATRVLFGLPELDALMGGGLMRETSTLVMGSLGTGKTLLALHLTAVSVAAGMPVVYLGFRENRRQLLQAADAFDLGERIRAALAPGGGLTLLRVSPVELDADVVTDMLITALDRARARILIVDSISELERAAARSGDPERVDDYLAALIEALRGRGVTALFIKEMRRLVAAEIDVSADAIAVLAENVLLLQQVTYRERLYRLLSVLKMRFSAHDMALREFTIAPPRGIRVLAPRESTAGALAGIAREQGEPAAPRDDRGTLPEGAA